VIDRESAAIIVASLILGILLAVAVDRWRTPQQATFHVLEAGK
jgi:hypothetical protein